MYNIWVDQRQINVSVLSYWHSLAGVTNVPNRASIEREGERGGERSEREREEREREKKKSICLNGSRPEGAIPINAGDQTTKKYRNTGATKSVTHATDKHTYNHCIIHKC